MDAFDFNSLIYAGYDFPGDGIGNHLALIDGLIFISAPPRHKSLHALPVQASQLPPYGRVAEFDHLHHPDRYKNSLFLDIARDMGSDDAIELAGRRAVDYKHGYNAVTGLYLMWESDRLSAAATRLAQCYDFVIVTSRILDDDLERSGLDWLYLPHPYDFAAASGRHGDAESGPTVFGISSGLWPRKHVALLAENFARTFGDDPGVRLEIHTRFEPGLADYRGESERLQALLARHPNIQLRVQHFSREQYLQWMEGLDIYCFVSAGEGYSVTPREALHLGKPVILLDAHVHSEFSHLPGVVRVRSSGMKPAVANHSNVVGNVGNDWMVDEESLRQALAQTRADYARIRGQLAHALGAVREFHDVGRIREQWIAALNDRYRNHIDRVCRRLPPTIAAERRRLLPGHPLSTGGDVVELPVQYPFVRHQTGELAGNRIYCFRSQHECGHCLFGQDYMPPRARRMTVQFAIRLIDVDENTTGSGAALVSLDVYDNRGDRMLAFRPVTDAELGGGLDRLRLEFDADPRQVLEFRVFWHRNCDISVHGVSVS